MSVLGLSDFILCDLLSDINMKPWWEKARGYCYAACVAASLFMFYFTLTTSTACVPLSQNVSVPFELTNAHTSLMNNYCISQLPWIVSHGGIILLAFVAISVIASSYWLYLPAVIDSFNTLKEVENIIKELLDQNIDLKSMITEPIDVKKGNLSLRTARELLFGYKCRSTVSTLYFTRNIILLCAIFAPVLLTISSLSELFGSGNHFNCSFTKDVHLNVHGVGDPLIYFCSLNIRRQLIPLFIVYMCAALCQIGFTVVGIIKAHVAMPDHIHSDDLKKAYSFCQFMSIFWRSADPTRSGAFGSFIEYVFCKEALDKMKTHLGSAVKSNDMRFIEMYCDLQTGGERYITKILAGSYNENKKGTIYHLADVNYVIKCLKHIQVSVKDSETRNFIKIAVECRHWHIFVTILSRLESEFENEKYIKSLKLNFDELGKSSSNDQRSILYFALSEPDYFKAAENLLRAMKDKRPKYVHDSLGTMSAEDFVKEVFNKNPHLAEQKLTELQKLIKASEGDKSNPSCSQMEISRISKKHQLDSDKLKDVEECFIHERMIIDEISSYRFTHWDTDAKNFAKYLASKKQWNIFVTLLNSYIAETTTNLHHFECGVDEFDVDGKNKNSALHSCLKMINNSIDALIKLPESIPFINVFEHMLYRTIPSEPGQSHPAMWALNEIRHRDTRQELKLKLEESMKKKLSRHTVTESDNQTQQPTGTQQDAETQHNSLPEDESSQRTPLLPVTGGINVQTSIDMADGENMA